MANVNGQIRVTREAYDVIILMKAGLGSNRIADVLGVAHNTVLSRQSTLEKIGVISKGTMNGERRRVLLADSEFTVEAEHRTTIIARAAADRAEAASRIEKAASRKAKRAAAKVAVIEPVS